MRIFAAKGDYLLNRLHPAGSHGVERYKSNAHAESIHDNPLLLSDHAGPCIARLVSGGPHKHGEQIVAHFNDLSIVLQLVKLSLKLLVQNLCANELLIRWAARCDKLICDLPGLC